jgi:hypothetical protein
MYTLSKRVSWLLGLSAIALAGCFQNNVSSDFSLESAKDSGVLVASLGRSGATDFNMTLTLRNVQTGKKSIVVVDNNKTDSDFGKIEREVTGKGFTLDWGHAAKDNPVGRLVVLNLPVGEYEIRGFDGDAPRFAQQSAVKYFLNSDPVAAHFTVNAGQITYLGSVVIAMPDAIYYGQPTGQFHVATADARDRDGKLLQQKYPRLGGSLPAPALTNAPDPGRPLKYYFFTLPDGGKGGGGSEP